VSLSRLAKKSVLLAVAVMAAITLIAYAYPTPTPSGYYLPRGYKVTATIYVPESPFWPGEVVGDEVGISDGATTIFAVGVGWKYWDGPNLVYDEYVKIVKQTGDKQQVLKIINVHNPGQHTVVITYTWDGQVSISVDGHLAYGFQASTDKYIIVAQGAHVNQPVELPRPKTDNPTGEGYNPPSVQDIQRQYLLLGLGAGAIIILVLILALRRRG